MYECHGCLYPSFQMISKSPHNCMSCSEACLAISQCRLQRHRDRLGLHARLVSQRPDLRVDEELCAQVRWPGACGRWRLPHRRHDFQQLTQRPVPPQPIPLPGRGMCIFKLWVCKCLSTVIPPALLWMCERLCTDIVRVQNRPCRRLSSRVSVTPPHSLVLQPSPHLDHHTYDVL